MDVAEAVFGVGLKGGEQLGLVYEMRCRLDPGGGETNSGQESGKNVDKAEDCDEDAASYHRASGAQIH